MLDSQSPVPLQDVWTRRELRSREGRTIHVSIGLPVFVGNGWNWVCPFRIEGLPDEVLGYTFGESERQVLERLAPTIRKKLEQAGVNLNWQEADFREVELPQLLGAAPPALLEQLGHNNDKS